MLSVDAAATLACIYEATAPKPGNVHPGASFDDATCYAAFVQSAVAIGPFLRHAWTAGVGQTVLDCVQITQQVVGTNTNLGTILLLAPLAAVPEAQSLTDGIAEVLSKLTAHDTRCAYEAIAASRAGGLGRAAEADVFDPDPPAISLVEAMRLAADRDLIARQYVNNFATVSQIAAWIEEECAQSSNFSEAIILAQLRTLASYPDSLICRKCGAEIAREASQRAADVMAAGRPREPAYERALENLDHWLRADGH
ncbi:MAG TPA: triphosphoribosyl-dephospho-CoA synthase, partial [Lacipirellulaceae bacterium]|nr:triphosphoribosyl-dephospho-CoA synthase [Lacipirellulaceae bacterium]